ncbi:hypothetical protein GUJ93_ZPchr0008g11413 [Zizania palustris]|uniref:Uncharacterized protein n=1 Tax=Zizania palustris TaxID=103762 RepID=A0A8J5R9J8_ZIZPA|nr:hypothetical protein GUJ93_ZPchr0008g11413 [Zizania palustris]
MRAGCDMECGGGATYARRTRHGSAAAEPSLVSVLARAARRLAAWLARPPCSHAASRAASALDPYPVLTHSSPPTCPHGDVPSTRA